MRILYLCHRIPYPPNKGDKIRAFHQLRGLAAAAHEVDLFTLADDPVDLVYRSALSEYCREVTAVHINTRVARMRALPFLFTRTPLTLPYFYSAELNTKIHNAILKRSYDRIVVYCSAMAQYVDSTDCAPVITDFVDVDSDKWTQYAHFARFPMSAVYRREGRRLGDYERSICEKSASVVVTTEREARLLRGLCQRANVHVITNGVDTTYFNPLAVPLDRTAPALIFTGDMSYFPNEEAATFFARKVLPIIQRSEPAVRFLIVGRNPGPNVRELERIAGVQVTGFVPDVRAYLAKAHVAVAPFSIAAGIQNKILEAMAFGLPVVCTTRATQGLSQEVAAGVQTGDTAEELAVHITRLLKDRDLASHKGADGRIRVAAEYSWDRSLANFLGLIKSPSAVEVVHTTEDAQWTRRPETRAAGSLET